MDLRKIKKLIDRLEESNLSEIEIKEGEESVRLSRIPSTPQQPPAPTVVAVPRGEPVMPMQSPVQAATGGRAVPEAEADAGPQLPDGHVVKSPMVGTFYRAPKPGAEPFVKVGSQVGSDTIIGIIEVMKLMNSIRAGVAGEVVEICAENGVLIEKGQPILRVRPKST